jgi:hypothetical protein
MAFSIIDGGYQAIHEVLMQFCKWLREHNVGLSQSRLLAVINTLEEVIRRGEEFNIDGQTYLQFREDICDAMSYMDVYAFLQTIDLSNEMIMKIRRAVKAPQISDEESDEKGGRNYLFELQLAAFFNNSGPNVVGFDDIEFDVEGRQILIECKRPVSKRQIGRRIRGAYNQLANNYRNDYAKGFIAISADKVAFPHADLNFEGGSKNDPLDTFEMSSFDSNAINGSVDQMTRVFQDKYRQHWVNRVDIRLIGIILVFRFAVRTTEAMGQVFVPSITPICSLAEDRYLLATIAAACRS